jgi:hypothetical protein
MIAFRHSHALIICNLFFCTALISAPKKPSYTSAVATLADHKKSYEIRPERGPYLEVKVTPPEARGKEGKVLVEVYNRGKSHIAHLQFDVVLSNRGGFDLSAQVYADDLRPNMSGAQWISVPKIKGAFPMIHGAKMMNLRIIDINAQEIQLRPYMDLIKN